MEDPSKLISTIGDLVKSNFALAESSKKEYMDLRAVVENYSKVQTKNIHDLTEALRETNNTIKLLSTEFTHKDATRQNELKYLREAVADMRTEVSMVKGDVQILELDKVEIKKDLQGLKGIRRTLDKLNEKMDMFNDFKSRYEGSSKTSEKHTDRMLSQWKPTLAVIILTSAFFSALYYKQDMPAVNTGLKVPTGRSSGN